jgi:hypothetical protein
MNQINVKQHDSWSFEDLKRNVNAEKISDFEAHLPVVVVDTDKEKEYIILGIDWDGDSQYWKLFIEEIVE